MRRILIQLDTDPLPSSFDRVVALDAGADEIFAYGGVTPENVTPLVHGAIFTRAPADLKCTAIFIGGSDVAAGAAVLARIRETFFGPMRVSVLLDSNGSNTTAAAAVRVASSHISLAGCRALVLGGTGPVGQRAGQLLCAEGAAVQLASRSLERADRVCADIRERVESATIEPVAFPGIDPRSALEGVQLLIAAGAAGVELLSRQDWESADTLSVAIDLNAVPPLGLGGIEVMDKGVRRGSSTVCYGAIGIGGLKMKLHRAAVEQLFQANDLVLDTADIYRISADLS